MNKLIRPSAVIVAYILTLIVNGLATSLPLFDRTTAEVSDSFKVFFVPSGYVFAIWGIIYLFLGLFTIWQALPAQRDSEELDKVGWLFILSSIANTVWLFFWHAYAIAFTLPVMLVLLVTLVFIYKKVLPQPYDFSDWKRNIILRIPFSIYLGWITVATIANATDYLYYFGIKELLFSGQIWSAILIVIAAVLGSLFVLRKKDIFYALVIIWAIIGIAVKFPQEQIIVNATVFGVAYLSVVVLLTIIKRNSLASKS